MELAVERSGLVVVEGEGFVDVVEMTLAEVVPEGVDLDLRDDLRAEIVALAEEEVFTKVNRVVVDNLQGGDHNSSSASEASNTTRELRYHMS